MNQNLTNLAHSILEEASKDRMGRIIYINSSYSGCAIETNKLNILNLTSESDFNQALGAVMAALEELKGNGYIKKQSMKDGPPGGNDCFYYLTDSGYQYLEKNLDN